MHRVRAVLGSFPEVGNVISQAGRPEDGTDPKPVNMVEIFVDIKPQDQWPRRISKEALIAEMNRKLEDLPGIEPSFSQPTRFRRKGERGGGERGRGKLIARVRLDPAT